MHLALSVSPASKWIAASSSDGSVSIWDIEDHFMPFLQFRAHDLEVWTCHFKSHAEDAILLTGSDDASLRVWDLRVPIVKPMTMVGGGRGHSAGVTAINSFGEEDYFITGRHSHSAFLST